MRDMNRDGEQPQINWARGDVAMRRGCMLIITQECNLNCRYCYERFKSSRRMTFETARRIIERERDICAANEIYQGLEIDFMGGEPLMNFELIKEIVEWVETGCLNIPVICFASTNGTLLTEEMKNWFAQHRDMVWLSLSYDGDSSMQSENRGDSANNVDLEFFRRTWPEQGVQMTLSRRTVRDFASGILALQRRGIVVTVSLAQGEDWTREDANHYNRELDTLAAAYLQHPELSPVSRLMRMVWMEEGSGAHRQRKFCGSGLHMMTYDTDGTAYGCHLFTPLVLGDKARPIDGIDLTCDEAVADPRCSNCILRNYCATCAGFNYRYRGSPARRDFSFCLMQLAEAKASCEFQMRLLASREALNATDAQFARAVLQSARVLDAFSVGTSEPPFESFGHIVDCQEIDRDGSGERG